MELDGALDALEGGRNLLVGEPAHHQAQYVALRSAQTPRSTGVVNAPLEVGACRAFRDQCKVWDANVLEPGCPPAGALSVMALLSTIG